MEPSATPSIPARRRLRRLAVPVLVFGAIGAGLCPSSAHAASTASVPVWAPKANAICAKAQVDVVFELQRKRIDPNQAGAAARAFLIAEGIYKRQIGELRALSVKGDERKKLDSMLGALEDALQQRKTNLAEQKVEKKNPFDEPTKRATELGLTCRF